MERLPDSDGVRAVRNARGEHGGRRNAKATMDLRSYKARPDRKWKNQGTTKVGGKCRSVVEVVWACDAKSHL